MFKNSINNQLKINSLGHAYNDAYHFIIPMLLPFFRQEFAFSYFQSGLIMTVHVALRSIFSLVFGSLGDRYNHKHLFLAFGFIFSSILLGSVVWISHLPFIITVLLLMAIGVSTFHPLATAMVGEKAKQGQQGRDLSLFSAAGTLGLAIISLLFGWFVQLWGWRITCFIIALPGFFLGWAYANLKNGSDNIDIGIEKTTHRAAFLLYFLARGIRSLGTWAILSFLPVYATDYIGLKPGISAWIISIYFAGVLTGSLFISRSLDRKNPLKLVNYTTFFGGLFILLLTYSTIPIVMGLLVTCIGLSQGIFFPAQNIWLTKISANETRGKMFGLGFFVEGFSATIAPSLYGWLADQIGLVNAYRLAVIPFAISLIVFIFLFSLDNQFQTDS